MTRNQENKISMYIAVAKTCDENKSIWQNLPAFSKNYDLLIVNLDKFRQSQTTQNEATKGVAQNKEDLEDELIQKAILIAGAIYVYASEKNDIELKVNVDIKRSELSILADTVIAQKVQSLYEKANSLINNLKDYGLTSESINEFKILIDSYTNALPSTRNALGEQKQATESVSELIKDTDSILKERLDRLMEQFKGSNTVFYSRYFSDRQIIDLGNRQKLVQKPVQAV